MQKIIPLNQIASLLEPFNFGKNINMANVFHLLTQVDTKYRNFSIHMQCKRILILPYTMIFFVNGTVVLKPFNDLHELLIKLVMGTYKDGTFDEYSPRIVMNSRFVVIDVHPNNSLRYKHKLYTMTKNELIINDSSIEELDYFQEIEIIFRHSKMVAAELSKTVI